MARYLELLSVGLACRYRPVVATLLCPNVACTRCTAAPRSSAWLAWAWRSQCGDTSLSTPTLLAAARTIRGLEGVISEIPMIALTANAMAGDREEYLTAGMNDYLAKPFDPRQLMAVIARVTEKKTGTAEVA